MICALLDRVRDHGAVVPVLWHLELGNVLLQAERRRRITAAHLSACLELIADLPITTDEETAARAARDVLPLAQAHALTACDACYLELALRRGLPLATTDDALAAAARSKGLQVLPE